MFSKLDETNRKAVIERCFESLECFKVDEGYDGMQKYTVLLQDLKFDLFMSKEDVLENITYAVDIIETMKDVCNNGWNKERFEKLLKENDVVTKTAYRDDCMRFVNVWSSFDTEPFMDIIYEIDCMYRLDGLCAILVKNPLIEAAILGVYEVIVDKFDDAELYDIAVNFLARNIMRLGAGKVEDNKDFQMTDTEEDSE